MEYTDKHIEAVFERLLQYEFTIVSGINCLEGCEICRSIDAGSCRNCLLYLCSRRTTTPNGWILAYDKDWDGIYSDVEKIKKRYPEICDLVDKNSKKDKRFHKLKVKRLKV